MTWSLFLNAGNDSLPAPVRHALAPLATLPYFGGAALILAVALTGWVIHDPLRAAKVFWKAIALILGIITKKTAASAVEADANQFLSRKLFGHEPAVTLPILKVAWVDSVKDARLHTGGTVIVRMRREKDQSRNVMTAVATALSHAIHPHARPYLTTELRSAVDLQILRLLANMLGESAQHIFSTELLHPEIEKHPDIQELLPVLHTLHERGLFGRVLLQELSFVSAGLSNRPGPADLAQEAREFVEWLHYLAVRPPHDETGELTFIKTTFRVAFILLARSVTAAQGTYAYERRLGIDIALGARSVYLLGLTETQTRLCEAIGSRFDGDRRVTRQWTATVVARRDGEVDKLRLTLFRRNDLYLPDGDFADQLAHSGVTVGDTVSATVRSLAETKAMLRTDELNADLASSDAAWGYRGSLSSFIREGDVSQFFIISIDSTRARLRLGLKQLTPSPWELGLMPATGQTVKFIVEEYIADNYVVRFVDDEQHGTSVKRYGRIPVNEWSSFAAGMEEYVIPEINSAHEAEVIIADPDSDDVVLSRRNVEVWNWDIAIKKYRTGTTARARVTQVTRDHLIFELEPGVFGRVTAANVKQAGFELENYEQTVVPGQYFDVVVEGVKQRRKDFRLNLARNIASASDINGRNHRLG